MADLIQSMKKAARDVIAASSPVEMCFGKVKSVDPFEIDIDQKLTLTEEFVILGRYVREYSLDLTIAGEMRHGFRVGDGLLLARMQGGQKYVIIDFMERVDEQTRPARVMTGEVVSDAPEIKVNDYLTLTSDQLILCRNVTEYEIDMSVSHETEEESSHRHGVPYPAGSYTTSTSAHVHKYEGRKKFIVHNKLEAGDKVLLVSQRISQKWYVVDFISRASGAVNGEWV